jgi:hypothetical protein
MVMVVNAQTCVEARAFVVKMPNAYATRGFMGLIASCVIALLDAHGLIFLLAQMMRITWQSVPGRVCVTP